jgi:hypothetical protein
MASYNKNKRTTQLELFELEELFIVTWTNKNGKEKNSNYPINMLNALRLVHVLGYDRSITNVLIKKAPVKITDAHSLAKPISNP